MDDRPQFDDVASAPQTDGGAVDTSASDDFYDRDFHAWTQDRAARLRAREDVGLDWWNIADEIEGLGASDRRELSSRLRQLILHLLKWKHQSGRRGQSWQTSIGHQRTMIEGILDQSPSLRRLPAARYEWAWQAARRDAARETGLPIETFPEAPEFAMDEALDPDYMPGPAWSPDELMRD